MTLDEGLRLDPLNSSMQQLHAEATRGVLGDLLEGASQRPTTEKHLSDLLLLQHVPVETAYGLSLPCFETTTE